MRKFLGTFSVVCTLSAAAFLGACNKQCDADCKGDAACCKEKAAAVRTDSDATPAATPGCCKDKAAAGCGGAKKTCPATGQSN